jgi:hypothetical protein
MYVIATGYNTIRLNVGDASYCLRDRVDLIVVLHAGEGKKLFHQVIGPLCLGRKLHRTIGKQNRLRLEQRDCIRHHAVSRYRRFSSNLANSRDDYLIGVAPIL